MLRYLLFRERNDPMQWRSHEPNRLESFSDAVFGFAITLLVLSLEVPKNFEGLSQLIRGIRFAPC